MTHLKKSLAMLLALIMMFSSMSVAASAVDTPAEEPSDITFTIKFFREDPKNPGQWIETTKAAPKEKIKARLYIKTGFYTTGGDTCFLFDDAYFTPFHVNPSTGLASTLTPGKSSPVSVNNFYAGPADDGYGAGEYGLLGSYVWKTQSSDWMKNISYILNDIEEDPHYLDNRDIISHSIKFASGVNNSIYTDDDWVCEFNFEVNDNPTTNAIDSKGEAKVPPYYYAYDRIVYNPVYKVYENAVLFIDIPRGDKGDVPDNNITMSDWIPDFDSKPATITTTSTVTFDMGLVDKAGNWIEDTYTFEKGIISKPVDLEGLTAPVHPDGLEFSHWSTQKPGKGVKQDKVTTFSYDYDDQTLYAVWGEPEDVPYILNEYYMDADGNYPTEVQGVKKFASPNSKVSAPESTDERFTLDKTKSDFNVVVDAETPSVVNAYYERNKYNLVYHYEDLSGEQTDNYSVRFGAELPAFSAKPSGEPDKTGYTFLGWTTTEGGTTVETVPSVMPANDLHLYPVYEDGETYDFEFIFDAKEGTFSDGNSIKRYSYKYLEEVIKPEEPTAPGKRFVGWDDDIPAKADGYRVFEAIYEDVMYKVTFKADKDSDGIYESTVSELDFVYGEKLYAEYAPENYPIDAWKLKDGTAVKFTNDEKTAYTVTGDTVLYTVGPDEYLAEFYLSQEDLDNDAEPYHSEYVKFDEIIPVPTKPEVPGYNFIVWIPDVEGGLLMDSTDGKDFVAVFEPKDIKVTFDPNGGECDVTSTTVKYEDSIEKLPAAARDGYEFLGWFDPDKNNVGKAGASYEVPTKDITLTAEWKAETHKIIFLDDDGDDLGVIEDETDEIIIVPENLNPPTKKGFEFTGWVNKQQQPTDVPATMPADDMVLIATWETIYYDITADANGGTFSDGNGILVDEKAYGDELIIEKPELKGHEFLGWAEADDESNKIITLPETMPDEAINIKAVWDTNKHDVYYDALGGIFTEEEGTPGFIVYKDVEYGKGVPVPDANPSKEGYEFVRWTPEKPDSMPDNELRFVAEWKKIEVPTAKDYTIYISYPNPSNPEEIIEVPVMTDSALPGTTVEVIKEASEQTKDKAHTYDEILEEVDIEGIEPDYENRPDFITVGENNNKIVVAFKLTEYTVTFNPNGGNFDGSEEPVILKGTYGQPVDAPEDPARTGYEFTGWNNDVPETFTESLEIVATWEIQKHDAIFVVYDEEGEVIEKITVEYTYGKEIEAPDYEAPAGYDFNGWDIPAGTKMGEDDITFESTLEPVYYSVSYEISGLPEDKGVSAPAIQTGYRLGNKPSVAKAPEVDGYTFDGWYDGRVKYNANGEDVIDSIDKDIVLTGTYTAEQFRISFNTNNADQGEIEDAFYNCDEIVEKLPEVTREGYEFLGWFEADEKYEDGFKMPAKDLRLKAEWKEIVVPEYTITYVDKGKVIHEANYKEGDPIEDFAPAAVPGQTFIKWDPELPETMPDYSLKVVAVWETNKHKVTYDPGADASFAEEEGNPAKIIYDEILYGAKVPVPATNPSKEGYDFVRWTPAAPEAMPDEDLIFTAEWEKIPDPEAQEYKIYVAYPNPSNPEEIIEVPVITDSALPGTTVEILKSGETQTADKAHTYDEILANVTENGIEPDYENRPAISTVGENNKIVVNFKLIEYTATFDGNEGFILDNNDVKQSEIIVKGYYGQPIEIPGDDRLVRQGHDFTGWDSDIPDTFTENTTHKATWELQIHDAYFYLINENGEEILIKVDSFEYGDEIEAPEYEAPDGYIFSGWDVADVTMGEEDMEFHATLTPIGFTLSYVIEGLPEDKGVTAPAAQPGLHAGKDAPVAAATPVEGYDFAGWFDEYDNEYFSDGTDAINMPAADVVLTGTYTAKEYTITFNSNGANEGEIEPAVYACDETVETLPDVTMEGYEFLGWYEGETKVEAGFKMPARDIALTAKWEKEPEIKYSIITLDANGGKFSNGAPVYPVKAEVGVPFNAVPDNPTRDGYKFIGWTDEKGNATSIPEKFPENDVTIKAAWAELYDITYYDTDRTTVFEQYIDTGMEGASVRVPETVPVKAGHDFAGWVDVEGNPVTVIPAHNVELYPSWNKIVPDKYTITYKDGDAILNVVSYEENAPIAEYKPEKVEGKTFIKWNPELPKTMPAENLTVFAVWETNKHDLTLDANGGMFEGDLPVFTDTFEYDTVLSGKIPANPTREGYEFIGWDGELPSKMPDYDVSLKAQWELKEYTITFDSNGGSDVPSQKYKFGDEVVAPEDPTREGFEFVKWNPELPETMPAKNITVVAEWKAVVVTKELTIDANGGEFDDGTNVKTKDFAVGEEIKDLPVPERDGFEFAGWTGIPEDGKMPAEDITIKAEWTPVATPEYDIEYYYAVDGALYTTLTFEEGEAIVHPAGPSVEGLTFKGWVDADGKELPETMPGEDLKAYAQFDVNTYKVTYIVDGSVYMQYDVLYQAEVPVPADPADSATRLFAGWEPEVAAVMPAYDLTYTATWVGAPEPDEYTATYLRHNGETHAKYVLEEGDAIPVPAAPQRFGYVFVGWEPEVPDTMPGHDMVFKPKYEVDKAFVTVIIGGTVIAGGVIAGSIIGGNIAAITGISIVGGIIVIVGVVELVKHTHTVTYLVDGEIYKSYKVVEGTKIPVPADPVKDGFKFEGWDPEVPERMGDKDLVFEATWGEVSAADDSTDVDVVIPETGSVAGGITAFAVISGAAAAAYVLTRRKKED